jgi:DNA-binding MltR family transcriptional regulator
MARNPKLRDLGRAQPDTADLFALSDELIKGEHPVATAILGAGLVEHHLEQLLRSKIKRKDDETWKLLVADNGPLKSFYSKIAMGYALGIYDTNMRGDLNIVRNIRNAFAHSKKLIQFDHPAVVKELKKATRSALPTKSWEFKAQCLNIHAPSLYMRLCYRLSNKLMKSTTYKPNPFDFKALLGGTNAR